MSIGIVEFRLKMRHVEKCNLSADQSLALEGIGDLDFMSRLLCCRMKKVGTRFASADLVGQTFFAPRLLGWGDGAKEAAVRKMNAL